MIKELFKIDVTRYFEGDKEGKKVIFQVYEHINNYTLEEIEKAFYESDLVDYIKERYTLKEILEENLNNLFQLDIYSWGNLLTPKNYNLYEFERIIQGNNNPHNSLKSASICRNIAGDYFYIGLEEYDHTSILNKENRTYIDKYLHFKTELLEKILNCKCSHVEEY